MGSEVCRLAMVSALLFSATGSIAASPPARHSPAPVAALGPISDALCGRSESFRARLAHALDEFDPIALPSIWREVEADNLQRWLEAPICPGASELESKLYRSRRMVLECLGRRLERAKVTEQIGPTLVRFRDWHPNSVQWPKSLECDRCTALLSSAARIANIASRWPPQTSTKVGARLGEAAKRESLVAELCAVKPSPGARAEIERRFRYYSWTADGVKLFEIAAWFEQLEAVAGCRDL